VCIETQKYVFKWVFVFYVLLLASVWNEIAVRNL